MIMQYIILKGKYKVSKIILGAAQLGLHYGINSVSQPTEDEVFRILKYAFVNGLNAIDTSPIYGSSERRIGEFIKGIDARKIFMITRLEAQDFPKKTWGDKKALSQRVEKEFRLSCANLNLTKIPAYILHFTDQAFKNDGVILDELMKIKKKGYIEFIGTSLYTSEELERCIADKRIDIVQIPFSILDRRLLESGLLSKARERGLIVFARSVYLQGLVFMHRLPTELNNARETINSLHLLADSYDLSISELCLRYAFSVNEIPLVTTGVDNLEQMKENVGLVSLGLFGKSILKEIERLPQMPPELIDVRSWSQSYNFRRN